MVLETDATDAPKWLNKEFLEKHLRNYFNYQKLAIDNFEVKPATAKGDNYASDLYRVKVTFAEEIKAISTLNVIVKTAVPGRLATEKLSKNNSYGKEMEFYDKIAPKINEKLKQLNETAQLVAEPYGVCRVNNAILFEDLKSKGYGIASIHRGLSFEETKIVLKKTALLHAINAVLQEEDPNIFENFKYGLMSRHTDALDTFFLTQFDALMEVVSTWPDNEPYIKKLQRLRSSIMERGAKAFDPDPKHFNTLIHGDLWVNNLMMKYTDSDKTEASIENLIFIDFQFSSWTSPAIDFHYFFESSLQDPLRPNRFDDLIESYHGDLVEYLKRLGYKQKILTSEELKQQYREKAFYGFIAATMYYPMFINEETDECDFEAFNMGDERSLRVKRLVYSSAKAHANLRKVIPLYNSMGVFD